MRKIKKPNQENKSKKQAGTKAAWMPEFVPLGGVHLSCGVVLVGDSEGNPTRLLFSPLVFQLIRLTLKLSSVNDAGELVSRVSFRWLSEQSDVWGAKQTHMGRQGVSYEHLRRLYVGLGRMGLILSRRESWGRWVRLPQPDAIRRVVRRILPPSQRGLSEAGANRAERRQRRARREKRTKKIPSVLTELSLQPKSDGIWRRFVEVDDEIRAAALQLAEVLREQDEKIKAAEQNPDARELDYYWREVHPVLHSRVQTLERFLFGRGVIEHYLPYFASRDRWEFLFEFLFAP